MKKLIEKFYWKTLTEEGRLVTPEDGGPSWEPISINGPWPSDGFHTAECALTYLLKHSDAFKRTSGFDSGRYTLISEFKIDDPKKT